MTSTIGIPIKLLNEAQVKQLKIHRHANFHANARPSQNHVVTLEITSGQVYRGKLIEGTCGFVIRRPIQFGSNPRLQPDFNTSYVLSASANERFSCAAEDNMNVQLKDITVTARDGRVSHLDQVYIRGSHVRFFIVPDMLRCGLKSSPNTTLLAI